ncbi:MAG: hypothetical protein FRX48_06810 [Lasallia pustulata]|uniref:Uncharacterized protein n=1 Tax=Lasallia pustulata TaxID=136370 RepID=A0A5M8PIU5_9LECA|nr:MAG: hypothetical protein FRX48_06810 [Lasallia pustulata]
MLQNTLNRLEDTVNRLETKVDALESRLDVLDHNSQARLYNSGIRSPDQNLEAIRTAVVGTQLGSHSHLPSSPLYQVSR